MVRKYLDGELGAFEIVAPVLHGFDNGQHFSIMNVIVAFGRKTFPRPKCHRVKDAIMRLADDSRDCCT